MGIKRRQDESLTVVLDEDMEKLLEALGLLSTVKSGSSRCVVCQRQLAVDDIAMIIPQPEGVAAVVCENPECIQLNTTGTSRR